MLCCILILIKDRTSTSKSTGVRKTVWESRSVDLQIESEKLLQIFTFFQKQKPALLQKKRGKAKKPFLSQNKLNLYRITIETAWLT